MESIFFLSSVRSVANLLHTVLILVWYLLSNGYKKKDVYIMLCGLILSSRLHGLLSVFLSISSFSIQYYTYI